jgi:multidrug efflux pump subunit AcrA (membrane-fusion protein)
VTLRLAEQDAVNPGTLLARLDPGTGETVEIRSPLPGLVDKRLVGEGQSVEVGVPIMSLAPSPEQVWEALRALVFVGRAEDLPEVERIAEQGSNDRVRQQAELTVRAIRGRH